jgi:hypothetical protein
MSTLRRTRKRKLAVILDPAFLRALMVSDGTTTTEAVQMLQLTNGAVQALHDCQESFVHELTRELKTLTHHGKNDSDEKQTQKNVNPSHVEAALRSMGLNDVLEEAKLYLRHKQEQEHQQQADEDEEGKHDNEGRTTKKKSRKKPTKSKLVFTEEMEAEQERLLQASIHNGGKDP